MDIEKSFKKVDKLISKQTKLLKKKQTLEALDDETLKQYVEILNELAEVQNNIDLIKKGELYESMLEANIDYLEGKNCLASLTKPYIRKEIDIKLFLDQYGPKTAMYKKYVKDKEIKGNVKIQLG